METKMVEEKSLENDASSLDVKEEPPEDNELSPATVIAVKEEIDIGPTVLEPVDMYYNLLALKTGPVHPTSEAHLPDQAAAVHLLGPQPTVRLVRLSETESRIYDSLLYNFGENSDGSVKPSESSTTKACLKRDNLIARRGKSQSREDDTKTSVRVRSQAKAQNLSVIKQSTQTDTQSVSNRLSQRSRCCEVCGKSFSQYGNLKTQHLRCYYGKISTE